MKYMNHLRKLALLSSLALSFSVAVQADGTLPLPVGGANKALPMEMAADSSDLTLSVSYMGFNPTSQTAVLEGKELCSSKSYDFYAAEGRFVSNLGVKPQAMAVKGVCKPRLATGSASNLRTVVLKTEVPGKFSLLTGTLETEDVVDPVSGKLVPSTVSFTGSFDPGTGTGAEAAMSFTLYRVK